MPKRGVSAITATLLVIANMIGTGIFTTTGYAYAAIGNRYATLMLWVVGGILALCGALSYAALGMAVPRSGGEYHFLSVLFHRSLGFCAGFVSLFAGFSAPIAASAIAFGKYFYAILPLAPPLYYAIALIILLTIVHSIGLDYGSRVQNLFTLLKIALILLFIAIGFHYLKTHPQGIQALQKSKDLNALFSTGFAISLVYVAFAYSGWNASTYIIGELRNPRKTVFISLFLGTLIVTLLYTGLNYVFLTTTPPHLYSAKEEIGHIVAVHLLGSSGGKFLSTLIAVALISSVSAMVMAGPRVTQVMGEDFRLFRWLAHKSRNGVPVMALWVQCAIALTMVLTATFQWIIEYISFTLSIFTFLTVLGALLKYRSLIKKHKVTLWGYPLTPVLFLLLNLWMMLHITFQEPKVFIASIATLGLGFLLYFLVHAFQKTS